MRGVCNFSAHSPFSWNFPPPCAFERLGIYHPALKVLFLFRRRILFPAPTEFKDEYLTQAAILRCTGNSYH
jgi:hypothetical protein